MHKHLSLAAVSLLLTLQASPILTHAQVVTVTEDYHPIYTDAVRINFTNGNYASDPDYDATQQVLIKNDSINVDVTKFHYIHFWDSTNNYLGYFKTAKGVNTSGSYLGELTTSNVPLPLGAYSFAVERFDDADADYDVTSGISLSELFNEGQVYNLVGDSDFDYSIVGGRDLVATISGNVIVSNNLIPNSDFLLDTDSNGIANGFILTNANGTLSSGFQTVSWNGIGSSYIIRSDNYLSMAPSGAKMYFSYNVSQNIFAYAYHNDGSFQTITNTSSVGFNSFVFTLSEPIGRVGLFSLPSVPSFTTSNWVLINLTTIFGAGNEPATATDFETWVSTYTSIDPATYYSSITGSQLDYPTWVNYYSLWSNNIVSGLEVIDQQYYLNGDRKYIFDLTALFGAGSEPVLATIQGWLADFDILISYNWVSHTAFVNQAITYDVSYWDDQVGESVTNGFILVMSGAVTFILMFLGFKTRAKLFNLLAIPGAIWFTIQGGASLPIILVGFGLVIMNALFFAKVD